MRNNVGNCPASRMPNTTSDHLSNYPEIAPSHLSVPGESGQRNSLVRSPTYNALHQIIKFLLSIHNFLSDFKTPLASGAREVQIDVPA
jgi:hypothetical protein